MNHLAVAIVAHRLQQQPQLEHACEAIQAGVLGDDALVDGILRRHVKALHSVAAGFLVIP